MTNDYVEQSEQLDLKASVKDICARFEIQTAERAISLLFGDASFNRLPETDLGKALRKAAEALPQNQHEALRIARQDDLSSVERLVAFRIAALAIRGNTLWLHYSIMRLLEEFAGAGIAGARAASVVHGLLAEMNASEAPFARLAIGEMLGERLSSIAAVDSLKFSLEAVQHGSRDAQWSALHVGGKWIEAAATDRRNDGPLRRLASWEPERFESNIERLQHLATAAGVALDRQFQFRTSPKSRVVVKPSRANVDKPQRGDNHYIFNSGADLERWQISIHSIDNALLSIRIGEHHHPEFYVFDEDEVLIPGISSGLRPFISSKKDTIDQTGAIISDQYSGQFNVCHFLLDHFTRLALYRLAEQHFTPILFQRNQYIDDSLAAVHFIHPAVHAPQGESTWRVRRLLVSSNLTSLCHPAHFADKWAVEFIRKNLIKQIPSQTNRRIFISREDATVRQLCNFSEIKPVLEEYGFDIVTLAGSSMTEQANLFSSAETIIGVHGAGLTNAVFMKPFGTVVEILPPLVATRAYWLLANGCKHNYIPIVAQDLELPTPDYKSWPHSPQYNDRNIMLDPQHLRQVLGGIGGRPS